jgi:hypothetical protein
MGSTGRCLTCKILYQLHPRDLTRTIGDFVLLQLRGMGISGSASPAGKEFSYIATPLQPDRRNLECCCISLPLCFQKFSNIHTLLFWRNELMATCRPSRAGTAHTALMPPISDLPGCSQMVSVFPWRSK